MLWQALSSANTQRLLDTYTKEYKNLTSILYFKKVRFVCIINQKKWQSKQKLNNSLQK